MDNSQLEEKIKRIKENQRRKRQRINLIQSPFLTIKYAIIVLGVNIQKAQAYCFHHSKIFLSLVLLFLAFWISYITPGSHQTRIESLKQSIVFCTWWITLGILSSIGLGTGLHTFVLYLGPHIAKVTLTATECNSVNFLTEGPNSFLCPPPELQSNVDFWDILYKVQLEAILWGFGTAIGELPPYFIARAARLAGESLHEVEELRDLQAQPETIVDQIKKVALKIITRMGFFGILLFASIPNPLFDLAGITCGHFLVPFWTFFGATVIGKAFIKTHLQVFFVISVFSVHHLETLIEFVEYYSPIPTGTLMKYIEEEKAKLHGGFGTHQTKHTFFGKIWDLFLIVMIGYFVLSIVQSSIQSYLTQIDDERIEELRNNPSALEQETA